MASIWVAKLHTSSRTTAKIAGDHHLDPESVRLAVECVAGLHYTWDDDPERGMRAIVRVTVGGERVLIVLYPMASPLGDEWRLGSAYPSRRSG